MTEEIKNIIAYIASWHRQHGGTLCVGISGSQGSGKTTITQKLMAQLRADYGLSVTAFSLDDIYKTKAARAEMARNVHPLFARRTLPGTHDIALGLKTLRGLKAGQDIAIPCFDKAIDDRTEERDWKRVYKPQDILLFEGWCVGARAVAQDDLRQPINDFEKTHDEDGAWRRAVNDYLRVDYPELWALLDRLIFLEIPSFSSVFQWRKQQEHDTFAKQTHVVGAKPMTDAQIHDFIGQAQRITEQNLKDLPDNADLVIRIDDRHSITALYGRAVSV